MKKIRACAPLLQSGENKRADCQGYLLVETLIAIAIFSIGFLAVGALILSTTRNNTTSNMVTQATLLAAGTLEDLKGQTLNDLAPGTYNDHNNPIDEHGNAGGIFNRIWIIDDPVGYNTSRRIRAQVSWNRLGQKRVVELATITCGKGT